MSLEDQVKATVKNLKDKVQEALGEGTGLLRGDASKP